MPSQTASTAAPKSQGRPQWLAWAIGSGAFAAFNGVFAKLTTASTTDSIADAISHFLGLSSESRSLEYVIRAMFLGMNQISNAIMWILFTRALTAASSTTQVSILNTSANFMVTAILGLIMFGEKLPLGWWAGASLLIAGTIVIGAQREEEKAERRIQHQRSSSEDVRLQESDVMALTLGAGGLEEDAIANARYKDDPDGPDDPPMDVGYTDEQALSSMPAGPFPSAEDAYDNRYTLRQRRLIAKYGNTNNSYDPDTGLRVLNVGGSIDEVMELVELQN